MIWRIFSSFLLRQSGEQQGTVKKFSSDKNQLYYLTAPEDWIGTWWSEPIPKETPIIINFAFLQTIDSEGVKSLSDLFYSNTWGWGLQKKIEKRLDPKHLCQIHLFDTKEDLLKAFEKFAETDHFCWSFEKAGDADNISLLGPLDSRQDETNIYHDIIGRLSSPKCVIDFSLCPFIDSSGIGFLLRLIKHNQRLERKVFLIGLNPQVRQALRLARLDHLLGENAFR